MEQNSIHLLHCRCKILWSVRIQFLRKSRQFFIILASVNVSPGSAIDNGLDIVVSHYRSYSINVSYIQICCFKAFNLIYICENVFVRRPFGNNSHFIT